VAFSLKMQEVLPTLAWVINNQKITDFYEAAGALETVLDDKGLGMDGAKWLAAMFDELEYRQSGWKPDKKELSTLFKLFPENFKKKITKEMLTRYLPREDWGHFDKKWSSAKLEFKKSLGSSPVILSEYYGNQLDCSVFLGDIIDTLGLSRSEVDKDYESTYAAIDETIGHDITLAALKRNLPNAKVKLIDYPNGSNLQDAKYECLVESDLDRKVIEKKIVSALRSVGFSIDTGREIIKAQYFSFLPSSFGASKVLASVQDNQAEDWDYALLEYEDGSQEIKVSDTEKWNVLDGTNQTEFKFVKPGTHEYTDDFKKLKKYSEV